MMIIFHKLFEINSNIFRVTTVFLKTYEIFQADGKIEANRLSNIFQFRSIEGEQSAGVGNSTPEASVQRT